MGNLYVAFIWNQHQPYYKNTYTSQMMLPWVRLHAVKDYFAMAALVKKYPRIKATINLTPCLLEQILDYQTGVIDSQLSLMTDPRLLNDLQKKYVLERFFDTSWNHKIKPHPRYHELLRKRESALANNIDQFKNCDFLDLQVLFNLTWLDREVLERFPQLDSLRKKAENFAEEDKKLILNVQKKVLSMVIPEHLEVFEGGQVELIPAPYFHPILPLIAKRSTGDALWHINQGKELFKRKAKGLWLPELAISQQAVELLAQENLIWTISDEDILAKSLNTVFHRNERGTVENSQSLYKPYYIKVGTKEIAVIFRDHHLSDLIGFAYNKMNYKDAVNDLIYRLEEIYNGLAGNSNDYLVTIALDGENAWNEYPDEKTGFLNYLYQRLSNLDHIKTTTPAEFLENSNFEKSYLPGVAEGSWVNQSFDRWIGSPSKNRAWALLEQTGSFLEQEQDVPHKSQFSYYAAQGSDYTWWFDSMPQDLCGPFDKLFRMHLANVYLHLNKKPPKEIGISILDGDHSELEMADGPMTMVATERNSQEEKNQ